MGTHTEAVQTEIEHGTTFQKTGADEVMARANADSNEWVEVDPKEDDIVAISTKEKVLSTTVQGGFEVYWYTSLVNGEVRSKGTDAHRVVLYYRDNAIAAGTHTKRIAPTKSNPDGWWGNLKAKVEELKDIPEHMCTCEVCEADPDKDRTPVMVLREGKYGFFLGCPNYDHENPDSADSCRNTKNYEKVTGK